jgi:sec-independent protein translocase protein TatB
MFDIGFSELLVIGLVALVVIGPERLPKVARTIGLLLGRMQHYVHDVKTEINREMQLDELKKLQMEATESARALEQSVRQEIDSAQSVFADIAQETQTTLAGLESAATDVENKTNSSADNAPLAENRLPAESPALSPVTPSAHPSGLTPVP